MKTVTSKRKEYQNTSFFLQMKEIREIRDQLSSIIDGEKETISLKAEGFDMVCTKSKEDMFTLTFDCESSN